jgi:8-oxo-dGTP pyrophosphatase MutT (NUDIX family)
VAVAKPYQIAAIPIRRDSTGKLEVLLVTSRETKRWVIPKGWPWRKVADHDAAAGEAWEEAGVKGNVTPDSIGTFAYAKRRHGKSRTLTVLVYLLEVAEVAQTWPEAHERKRSWFSPSKAAGLVDEPALKSLLFELDAR